MLELSSVHLEMFGFLIGSHKPTTNIMYLHIHIGYIFVDIRCGKITNV